MKNYQNYLTIILLALITSFGCQKVIEHDIRVNGKKIQDIYKLALYETKPDRAFALTMNSKTYLKLMLTDRDLLEVKFDFDKVSISTKEGLVGQYVQVYWTNKIVDFNNFAEAFSNAQKAVIYTESYVNGPLNMEY